ncbi:MAG: ImmA/IrrE family metallo-endopeptidase, partial [Bacteroidota bacterium]
RRENFYFAALRSYQEMHDNYFPELEQAADEFRTIHSIGSKHAVEPESLRQILIDTYGYQIDSERIPQFDGLRQFRSVFDKESKILYVNPNLTRPQQAFLYGKEIAFNHLGLADRPYTSNLFQVRSFEEVLANFQASYFSVALLLNEKLLLEDLKIFFARKNWNTEAFMDLLNQYSASPEMFLQRLVNLLPTHFGLDQVFLLRFNDHLAMEADNFDISKELHIGRQHTPRSNLLNEHYCRRWVSIRILQSLRDAAIPPQAGEVVIDVQRSTYVNSKESYFCISMARANAPTPQTNISVTIGILVDEKSSQTIGFLQDQAAVERPVNVTCERCAIADCQDRAAAPSAVEKRTHREHIRKQLSDLLGTSQSPVANV